MNIKSRSGSVLIIALVVAVVLAAAGGIWYWEAHNNSVTQPSSQSTTAETSSTAPSQSATQTTSTYQNADYGISFEYPSNWIVKPGDTANGDYGFYTQYDSNTISSLITVEIPPSLYPGTNFEGGYFNLSIGKQLKQNQCSALLPPFGPNNIPDKVIVIDGVTFTRYAAGGVAAGTDEYAENYTGYTNGTCYEFNLGDTTGNDISPTGTKMSGSANDIPVLEGVLSSIKFTGSTTAPQSSGDNGISSSTAPISVFPDEWTSSVTHNRECYMSCIQRRESRYNSSQLGRPNPGNLRRDSDEFSD